MTSHELAKLLLSLPDAQVTLDKTAQGATKPATSAYAYNAPDGRNTVQVHIH